MRVPGQGQRRHRDLRREFVQEGCSSPATPWAMNPTMMAGASVTPIDLTSETVPRARQTVLGGALQHHVVERRADHETHAQAEQSQRRHHREHRRAGIITPPPWPRRTRTLNPRPRTIRAEPVRRPVRRRRTPAPARSRSTHPCRTGRAGRSRRVGARRRRISTTPDNSDSRRVRPMPLSVK